MVIVEFCRPGSLEYWDYGGNFPESRHCGGRVKKMSKRIIGESS